MDNQDILALGFAAAAVVYVVRVMWKAARGRGGCGCSRTDCKAGSGKPGVSGRKGPTALPFVSLDQVRNSNARNSSDPR